MVKTLCVESPPVPVPAPNSGPGAAPAPHWTTRDASPAASCAPCVHAHAGGCFKEIRCNALPASATLRRISPARLLRTLNARRHERAGSRPPTCKKSRYPTMRGLPGSSSSTVQSSLDGAALAQRAGACASTISTSARAAGDNAARLRMASSRRRRTSRPCRSITLS